MPDYQKGKIYKLFNKVNDKYYIGSTIQELRYRKRGHKYEVKTKPNLLKSKEILKIGWLDSNGKQNWFMKKICDFPCSCLGELEKEEGKYQKLAFKKDGDLVLNMCIAGRTKKEHHKDNKEKINAKKRELIKCEICSISVSRNSMSNHKRTIKCQEIALSKGLINKIMIFEKKKYITKNNKKDYDKERYEILKQTDYYEKKLKGGRKYNKCKFILTQDNKKRAGKKGDVCGTKCNKEYCGAHLRLLRYRKNKKN